MSVFALLISIFVALRQFRLGRETNTLPVLVDLFREHRGPRLAEARAVVRQLQEDQVDLKGGLSSLPRHEREMVRELAWFYDNVGVLVAHKVVLADPIIGYLGGSVVAVWETLEPLIAEERRARSGLPDALPWQEYFEMLYKLAKGESPAMARERARGWKFGS